VEYPVVLERDDNGTVLVTLPDFPEVHTFGEDEPDALAHAVDALATGIDAYVKDRRDIPLPSAVATRHRVTLPALSEAKVRLYGAMRRGRVSKSELSRRLKWHPPQVDRLLDLKHESRLSQLEAAFGALGKKLVIGINDVSAERTTPPRSRLTRSPRRRGAGHAARATATDRRERRRR
jgi:antitoxin HicB